MFRIIFLFLFLFFFPFPTHAAPPQGWIDSVEYLSTNQLVVKGWAKDPDDTIPIKVHFYLDGPAGSGKLIGSVTANQSRNDVSNHGYSVNLTLPTEYQQGIHTLFAHGIDLNGSENALLKPVSGKKFGNPAQSQFGIFYVLWHCRAAKRVFDISKIQKNEQNWGPIPWYHWWGEPKEGYYCLTERPDVLEKHAIQLRDAGINFVFLDITNWRNYDPSPTSVTAQEIQKPFLKMLEVWSKIENAPKIVLWARTRNNENTLFYWMQEQLDRDYPSLRFIYQGKPLVLPYTGGNIDPELNAILKQKYTLRDMSAYAKPGSDWHYIQKCADENAFRSAKGTITCNQPVNFYNNQVEQVAVAAAYNVDYISDYKTAIPKYDGRTFRQQFQVALENMGAPIITITGWNEWIAQRFCIGANKERLTDNCYSEFFPDGSGVFVDQYDVDRNRDLEPAKGGKENYYYELMKSCISLYKSGKNCLGNSQNLCCRDYSTDWQNYIIKPPSPSPTSPPSITPSPLPGDANGDHMVDLLDLNIWQTQYRLNVFDNTLVSTDNWSADFNRDKKVNLIDYSIWRENFCKNKIM